jgi:pimeloyl-ACP methyl ester carboxylesterase
MDTILEETRTALQSVGENGPFILFPHSVSGLEAIYWLGKYPEEIAAIIGLDMGFPEYYLNRKRTPMNIDLVLMNVVSRLGIHRVYYPKQVSGGYFTADEYRQAKYLMYRNFMNISVRNELKNIYANAEKVYNTNYHKKTGKILLFSSNGSERGISWVHSKREFAERMGAELVVLDCDHYVHHFESEKIMEKSKQFINELLR